MISWSSRRVKRRLPEVCEMSCPGMVPEEIRIFWLHYEEPPLFWEPHFTQEGTRHLHYIVMQQYILNVLPDRYLFRAT